MKRNTVIVAIVMLVIGLALGKFFLDDGGESLTLAPSTEQAAEAPAADKVRWKMASAFASELVQLGDQGQLIEKRIGELSGGTMEVKFFEPSALVPALEILDAVSAGSVDAGWSAAGYWAGKVPALQFFTAVPFGPRAGEAIAGMENSVASMVPSSRAGKISPPAMS